MTKKYDERETMSFAVNRLRRSIFVLLWHLGIYRMLKRIEAYLTKGGR